MLLLIYLGPIGAGNLWLLGFSLITALTLGEKGAISSLIINTVTQIIFYVLISESILLNEQVFNIEADVWLIRAVNFIVINFVIVITTSILSRKLKETFSHQKKSESRLIESENPPPATFSASHLNLSTICLH